MSRLIVSTQMTVDGVIDSTDGWFIPDGEHGRRGFKQLLAAEALLLGRKTYEGLAGAWSGITNDHAWADRINPIRRFVASRTLAEPLERNATLIQGDVAEGVSRLKTQLEGDLVMYGCGGLARHLVRHGLVDEIRLWVHPVVWGRGERLFYDGEAVPLKLVDSMSFGSGVTLLRYQPANHGQPGPASRS